MPQAQASAVLLGGLDPHQRAAVVARAGPLLVAAGAGSGKTLVLTRRIAHLIAADGLAPEHVLAIAFTNRAARELKTRVAALVGEAAARRAAVATFHAACHRFLVRPHAERLGRSAAFSIYDGHDSQRLLAEALPSGSLGSASASSRWESWPS